MASTPVTVGEETGVTPKANAMAIPTSIREEKPTPSQLPPHSPSKSKSILDLLQNAATSSKVSTRLLYRGGINTSILRHSASLRNTEANSNSPETSPRLPLLTPPLSTPLSEPLSPPTAPPTTPATSSLPILTNVNPLTPIIPPHQDPLFDDKQQDLYTRLTQLKDLSLASKKTHITSFKRYTAQDVLHSTCVALEDHGSRIELLDAGIEEGKALVKQNWEKMQALGEAPWDDKSSVLLGDCYVVDKLEGEEKLDRPEREKLEGYIEKAEKGKGYGKEHEELWDGMCEKQSEIGKARLESTTLALKKAGLEKKKQNLINKIAQNQQTEEMHNNNVLEQLDHVNEELSKIGLKTKDQKRIEELEILLKFQNLACQKILADLQETNSKQLAAAEHTLNEERQSHATFVEQMVADHEKTLAELRENHEEDVKQKLEKQQDTMMDTFLEVTAIIKRELRGEMDVMKTDYETQIIQPYAKFAFSIRDRNRKQEKRPSSLRLESIVMRGHKAAHHGEAVVDALLLERHSIPQAHQRYVEMYGVSGELVLSVYRWAGQEWINVLEWHCFMFKCAHKNDLAAFEGTVFKSRVEKLVRVVTHWLEPMMDCVIETLDEGDLIRKDWEADKKKKEEEKKKLIEEEKLRWEGKVLIIEDDDEEYEDEEDESESEVTAYALNVPLAGQSEEEVATGQEFIQYQGRGLDCEEGGQNYGIAKMIPYLQPGADGQDLYEELKLEHDALTSSFIRTGIEILLRDVGNKIHRGFCRGSGRLRGLEEERMGFCCEITKVWICIWIIAGR